MRNYDNKFSDNVKNLENISLSIYEDNQNKELIRALSFFLSKTNREYCYNETYLIDQYERFKDFLVNFNIKHEIAMSLCGYLNDKAVFSDGKPSVRIHIDNLWIAELKEALWVVNVISEGNVRRILKKSLYITYIIGFKENSVEMHEEVNIGDKIKTIEHIVNNLKIFYDKLMNFKG